ncbi:MAG: NAD(+)/NADH kinase [Peptostreptococcaceae bacterium]
MDRTITIYSNSLQKSIEVKNILIQRLNNEGYEVNDKIEKNTELIICIGGDGSLLDAIHKFKFPNIPVIVINTGNLGFFAEITPSQIDEFIQAYKNKEFFIQETYPLEASICTNDKSIDVAAINEIVIKNIQSRTVHLELKVNQNKIQKFSGDGVLISTPIGSTAYNYSAGGSIIDPSLNLFQLTPIAPMNTKVYRSFTSSIILPIDSKISIYPEYRFENSILIVIDGKEYKFSEIEKVIVFKSNLKVKLLRLNDYEFWNRVSEKFL